jgi:trehalose 6-phosphate phosphatase
LAKKGCVARPCDHFEIVNRSLIQPPLPPENAVFLDIDGTLLDLASPPTAVIVPPNLPRLLQRLSQRHGGAIALISGRALADIDGMFGPGFAVAAEHGAVLRDASGEVLSSTLPSSALAGMADELRAAVAAKPGALLEEKKYGLVLHWRGSPEHAGALIELAAKCAAAHPELVLQAAHDALEIRIGGTDKASALETFMSLAPFTGRVPVFVGDDLTDEAAIARAAMLGGYGLHVHRSFNGSPAAVRAWLAASLADEGGA